MVQCPNCSYELVLLDRRLKYKCALCSRLYPQKWIENKEFREWNQRQKLLDIEDYKNKHKEELSQLRKLRSSIKLLFKSNQPRKYRRKILKPVPISRDYKEKVKLRLNYYRQRQKLLAQLYLKNYNKKTPTSEFFKSPPTFVHSYLLK